MIGSFQIRGDDHPHGPLYITPGEDPGTWVLDDGKNLIELGDGADALLVAKCVEVTARSKVSDEFEEVSRNQLRRLLEQVQADHQLLDEPKPEP